MNEHRLEFDPDMAALACRLLGYDEKGQSMRKFPLEVEAEAAALRLYRYALRLSATPKDEVPNYHAGRSADFEEAMAEMAAAVDRWRAECARKQAEDV